MTSPTPPPYVPGEPQMTGQYPQPGWAGMAQPTPKAHAPEAALVVAGAGAALVVGSFLPWATVTAPLFGSISMSGTDGSDGWVTVAIGIALIAYGIAARARRLPLAADIVAILAGVAAIMWAGYHVLDVQDIASTMEAGMAQTAADDPLGLASSIASAAQVKVGGGLWLLVAAGLVATLAAGFRLYKRG